MSKKSTALPENIPDILKNYQVEQWAISSLCIDPGHPRKISERQKEKAAKLIHTIGICMPILVDERKNIIIGQEWLYAAQILGLDKVPVIVIDKISQEKIRLLRIGYHKIQDLGQFDLKALASEFKFFLTHNIEIESTAFETPELDFIIMGKAPCEDELHDNIIPSLAENPISQIGDMWLMGDHKIFCGSATDKASYEALLNGKLAKSVITDPPYNVPNKGHTGGSGAIKHREFVEAYGEKSEEEFIEFLFLFLSLCSLNISKGGLIYSFMDWRHQYEMVSAFRKAKLQQVNIVVWNKTNGAMGSMYRSKHEFVHILKKDKEKHTNNIELGKHGRYRTNVWDYAGINSFGEDRMEELSMHPTVKPVSMISDAILDCSHHKDIILDPFSGSGTIFIACEKTGRCGYGLELDPLYVDTAIRRWQKYTGNQAINAKTNLTFDQHAKI